MEKQEWSRKLLVLLGPLIFGLVILLVVFLFAEWRMDSHIQKVADVCAQAGMAFETINFWSSVESRCMPGETTGATSLKKRSV